MIIRVFPRKTNATPFDENVRFGLPGMFDVADEIHISVTFTWDKKHAEFLAKNWEQVAPVKIGGPAYGDSGNEFIPGQYIKPGYVITSRGCPNRCWFCSAWRNEGNQIRELTIKDGWDLLDNNILACSEKHQEAVYKMLLRQCKKPKFTGGLEAARFTEYHAGWIEKLKPSSAYFAYDTPDDYEPLVSVSKLLDLNNKKWNHTIGCYVLIGYQNDTIEKAEKRLIDAVRLGFFPQAMLFNRGDGLNNKYEWRRLQRVWANKIITGSMFKKIH